MFTPQQFIEKEEIELSKIAAKIALDAHKQSKHYARFSEIIYQGIKSAVSSRLLALIELRDKELREEIEELPMKFPERESDEYDAGAKDFKEKVLSLLPKVNQEK